MSVSGLTTHNDFTGNATGLVDDFDFTFKVIDAAQVTVTVDDSVQSSGITITLNEDQDNSPGGTVAFDTPPADGTAIIVFRDTDLTQATSLTPYSPFPAKTVETALDRLTMITQELEARIAAIEAAHAG